jgi:hypothetical protein
MSLMHVCMYVLYMLNVRELKLYTRTHTDTNHVFTHLQAAMDAGSEKGRYHINTHTHIQTQTHILTHLQAAMDAGSEKAHYHIHT